MTRSDIIDAIAQVLAGPMQHRHMEAFSPTARLNQDLYLDSVLILQIFLNLELEHGLMVDDAVISRKDVVTVADLADLFLPERRNSRGLDLSAPAMLERLERRRKAFAERLWRAAPLLDGPVPLPAMGRFAAPSHAAACSICACLMSPFVILSVLLRGFTGFVPGQGRAAGADGL